MPALFTRPPLLFLLGLAWGPGLASATDSGGGPVRKGQPVIAQPASPIPVDSVTALAFSPDGTLVATFSSIPRLYDLATGRELARGPRLPGPSTYCRHLAFSADGRRLVSAHQGGLIGQPDLYVFL